MNAIHLLRAATEPRPGSVSVRLFRGLCQALHKPRDLVIGDYTMQLRRGKHAGPEHTSIAVQVQHRIHIGDHSRTHTEVTTFNIISHNGLEMVTRGFVPDFQVQGSPTSIPALIRCLIEAAAGKSIAEMRSGVAEAATEPRTAAGPSIAALFTQLVRGVKAKHGSTFMVARINNRDVYVGTGNGAPRLILSTQENDRPHQHIAYVALTQDGTQGKLNAPDVVEIDPRNMRAMPARIYVKDAESVPDLMRKILHRYVTMLPGVAEAATEPPAASVRDNVYRLALKLLPANPTARQCIHAQGYDVYVRGSDPRTSNQQFVSIRVVHAAAPAREWLFNLRKASASFYWVCTRAGYEIKLVYTQDSPATILRESVAACLKYVHEDIAKAEAATEPIPKMGQEELIQRAAVAWTRLCRTLQQRPVYVTVHGIRVHLEPLGASELVFARLPDRPDDFVVAYSINNPIYGFHGDSICVSVARQTSHDTLDITRQQTPQYFLRLITDDLTRRLQHHATAAAEPGTVHMFQQVQNKLLPQTGAKFYITDGRDCDWWLAYVQAMSEQVLVLRFDHRFGVDGPVRALTYIATDTGKHLEVSSPADGLHGHDTPRKRTRYRQPVNAEAMLKLMLNHIIRDLHAISIYRDHKLTNLPITTAAAEPQAFDATAELQQLFQRLHNGNGIAIGDDTRTFVFESANTVTDMCTAWYIQEGRVGGKQIHRMHLQISSTIRKVPAILVVGSRVKSAEKQAVPDSVRSRNALVLWLCRVVAAAHSMLEPEPRGLHVVPMPTLPSWTAAGATEPQEQDGVAKLGLMMLPANPRGKQQMRAGGYDIRIRGAASGRRQYLHVYVDNHAEPAPLAHNRKWTHFAVEATSAPYYWLRGPGNLALLRLDSTEPPADLLRRILDTCLKYMHQHKATP